MHVLVVLGYLTDTETLVSIAKVAQTIDGGQRSILVNHRNKLELLPYLMSLHLVAELIDDLDIGDGLHILSHVHLDLQVERMAWLDLSHMNLFRNVQYILKALKHCRCIFWPSQDAIINQLYLLCHGGARCKYQPVWVAHATHTTAQH